MSEQNHHRWQSLTEQEAADTQIVSGLFESDQATQQALSALVRHKVSLKETVQIFDASKLSPEDSLDGESGPLARRLSQLGLPADEAAICADKIKQGYTLLLVKATTERAETVRSLLEQTGAETAR